VVVRVTADCPFLDPEVIGAVVRLRTMTGCSYASNISPRTWPDGLDVEAFTIEALFAAEAEAWRPIDRECVTTWIERNRSRFPAETLICPIPDLQDCRWVLDTAEDYAWCQKVAALWRWELGPPSMLDILDLLDHHSEIPDINGKGLMNERYFAALAEEPIYTRSYERSQAALARAEKVIPLGAQTFSKSRLQFAQPSPLFLTHGDGALVFDVDGNEYVDLVSALLPIILGYRDPEVDAAIRKQLGSGVSFSLATELEAELAETLCRLIPCAEAVRFGKSGTDATTAAIRAARAFTGRNRIVICGGYHGWADWSVERNLGVPEDVRKWTTRAPFGATLHPDSWRDCAAIIVEPDHDPTYLRYLRELCDKEGLVLIFDEIITGFRFDLGGAQKHWGVTPDLACFGKAMANGMPLSAIVGRKDIMAKFAPPDNIFYSGTFFGEALSLAAGIATIKKLKRDDVPAQLCKTGAVLSISIGKKLRALGLDSMIQLKGHPCRQVLKFWMDDAAALFRREMIASGTLITNANNISAAHGKNEVTRILKSYDHALGFVAEAVKKGKVTEWLAGGSIEPGVHP